MRHDVHFIITLLALLSCCGFGSFGSCGRQEPQPDPQTSAFETYELQSIETAITTEYARYKFLSKEKRRVYVGGNAASSSLMREIMSALDTEIFG